MELEFVPPQKITTFTELNRNKEFNTLAHQYVKKNTDRHGLMALHAFVCAELFLADDISTDPNFAERVRELASNDYQTGSYEGYTCSSWIELWRYFIYYSLPESDRETWAEKSVLPEKMEWEVSWNTNPIHPFTKAATKDLATTIDHLQRMGETLVDSNHFWHQLSPAERLAQTHRSDTAIFKAWLLERSNSLGDYTFIQADVVWDAAMRALATPPGKGIQEDGTLSLTDHVEEIREKLIWGVPSWDREEVKQIFPPPNLPSQ